MWVSVLGSWQARSPTQESRATPETASISISAALRLMRVIEVIVVIAGNLPRHRAASSLPHGNDYHTLADILVRWLTLPHAPTHRAGAAGDRRGLDRCLARTSRGAMTQCGSSWRSARRARRRPGRGTVDGRTGLGARHIAPQASPRSGAFRLR